MVLPQKYTKEIYTQAYKCEFYWKYDDLHAIYAWHNTGSNKPLVVIALPKQKSQEMINLCNMVNE